MKKRILAGGVAVVFLIGCMGTGLVTQATSTADKLNKVEQEKKQSESQLDKTTDKIEDLKIEKLGLQQYLNQLNSSLEEATMELDRIEELIIEKEELIANTQVELEEAKKQEVIQYEAMKKRIQFMYEKSQNLYLEILFSSESFVKFLNHAQYIEKLTEYDRNMLEAYKELQEEIKEDEEFLLEEKESLVALKGEADTKKSDITTLVDETHGNVAEYMAEISEQEKAALALEEKIKQQTLEAADLQQKLQEEIELSKKAANSETRDLSGIQFSATDLDMMAAIIECEAGGESYVGKVAVGAVVMNRVRSSLFPDTVAGVIYQNKQFSPVGSGRFAIVLARGAREDCYEAAREAMSGVSPVGNCIFFRTPIPGLTGIQIGGHIFY